MIEQNLVAHIQTFGQWKIFQLTQWLFEKIKKKKRDMKRGKWLLNNTLMKSQTYLVILILLILDFNWLQSNCDLETEKGGRMHKQIALLRANQIARIASDFKMDLINLYIYWYYFRLPLKLIDYISFSFQGFFYWSEKSSQE